MNILFVVVCWFLSMVNRYIALVNIGADYMAGKGVKNELSSIFLFSLLLSLKLEHGREMKYCDFMNLMYNI